MVKNLAQLEKLEISNCSSMREVIVTEELEEEILFPKLDLLKLKHLSKLERFCSGNLIRCPLLNVLRVESCPYLQTFVSSSMRNDVGITTLFDEKVSFPKLEELQIFHMHRLGMIWKNEFLAAGSFDKLKVLKVEHAKELLQLFPSNMLIRGLRNLETLVVKHCDLMKQVFDMEGLMQVEERLVVALRTLNVQDLPMLKSVWNGDAYGMETVSWNNLRSVTAKRCPCLKSLFPAPIATDLLQLEVLCLTDCAMVEVIVEGLETSPTFSFPKLKFIELWRLYELRNFYPGAHTLECPVLETLWVHRCEKLDVFALESPNLQETHVTSKAEVQPLFSFAQLVPNLKKMTLTYKDIRMIKEGHLPTHLFHKLEVLELERFYEESSYFPFEFLHRFQNIKKLYVSCSHFVELFPGGLAGDDQTKLNALTKLKLNALTKLRRIWNQGSQHKQALQNLDTLQVLACDRLISLVPSFPCFQNLQTLEVYNCDGLVNLFESTAANLLVHLKTISISECYMITEIVATKEDEVQTEITLIKLESLKLHCLKSLVCFSFANCPVKFPSLTEVIITQCPKMKFFSQGNLSVPKLKKVYVTKERDKWRWVGDLNSTIKQLYVEMAGFDGMQQLELSQFPELKGNRLSQLPVNFFYNLTSLVVDNCAFLSVAIPSNLLPFLIALEKLEIRNCDLLEELFDLNADRSFGYLSNLKEFQLTDLPKLRHVWDGIPKHMLVVKNLTLLTFHNCGSLRYILTPTMCLGLVQLKNLEVTSCQMIEEIISPPASTDGTIAPTITFPLLECVFFENLPNITCFYSGIGSVECPCLTEVTVAACPQLNITNTIAESKVASFPRLKDFKLSSIDIQKMWNCQSLTSLVINGFRNLKFLFSSSVAESLVNLKKVEISNCGMMEQVIAMDGHEEQMMRLLKIDFLKLKDLPKLAQFSICSMLECPSLKELQIENCPQLMPFVSNSSSSSELQITSALFDEKVSFPNLEKMQVIKMDNLRMIWSKQLYSDSFDKLEIISITKCGEVSEIVSTDDESKEAIFFTRLQRLELNDLASLVSFCSAKCSLNFPSLTQVIIWKCPNIKFFSKQVPTTPKLKRLQCYERDKGDWNGNLNDTIRNNKLIVPKTLVNLVLIVVIYISFVIIYSFYLM
ncbi:uncharacterized protein [Euphorbia lathyris]